MTEQRAHEFAQQQHVETFVKLAEAERATTMAMRMHDVQFERANRLQTELAASEADRRNNHAVFKAEAARLGASLTQIRGLCNEVHGHGADTLEGEMWRLRTIINRIDAVVSHAPLAQP